MMFVGTNSLYVIVYTLLLMFFVYIFPGMIFQTFFSILGFVASLLLSIYLSYCIYFIMVCFAFWFGEVRSIVVAYNVGMLMISGQYIPIRLFPEKVLTIIEWTPIPYLVDLPVSIATGIIPPNEWIFSMSISFAWCLILTIISFIIYKAGIKGYEAYGQ
jgi:ABC-2 type transport system permease protein